LPFLSIAQYLADNAPRQDKSRILLAGDKAYRSGDVDLAIALFGQVMSLDPENAEAYHARAIVLERSGRYKEAIRDADQLIALDERKAEAYTIRARANKGLGNLEAACTDLNKSRDLGCAEAGTILSNTPCP
jgi:tetratricopeptide (TPR) repeat protein